MSLIELKNYLRQQKQVTLTDLANHFDTELDTMRALLAHWQNKGKVVQIHHHNGCGKGCGGCCQQEIEIVRWQEKPDSAAEFPVVFKTNH